MSFVHTDRVWWEQIGSSLRFLDQICYALRDGQSAVLQLPRRIPWRHTWHHILDLRRSAFSGERRLMRLSWEEGADPGEVVLDELCSSRTRANYWPGISYAQYLGSQEELVLNDYYVWVHGVHTKSDLAKWVEFLAEYEANAKLLMTEHAVFIVEYDGLPIDTGDVKKIGYTVEYHDCRVFCLETAAAMQNTDLRSYQAELALSIGQGQPEVCAELLAQGENLLRNPVKTAQAVLSTGFYSERIPFECADEPELRRAVWKAAMVLLFPILEQYRCDFIDTYKTQLAQYLPISNSNGDRITDPQDLEIGPLHHIVSNAKSGFTPLDVESVKLCRKARNLLAHNHIVPYDDVKALMDL